MSILQAVILGIIQGATEFLPISSTAHLAIVPWLAGWQFDPDVAFVFDVLVQLGTVAAVMIYFRRDLWGLLTAGLRSVRDRSLQDPQARLAWLVVVATIPAGLAGLLLKKLVSDAIQQPAVIGTFLLFTATLLFLAEMAARGGKNLDGLRVPDAIWIGLAQAVALFPGVSRSGSTIAAGLLRGMDRPAAARFSFLMSVPIMLGAGLLEIVDVVRSPLLQANLLQIGAGFLASGIVGFAAIAWLMRFLQRNSLRPFAVYCAAAGMAVIAVSIWVK